MGLKRRLVPLGFKIIAATRAARWAAPLARGRGVVLMFHHVRPAPADPFAPNALLEVTPEFLDLVLQRLAALGFALIGIDDLPARLAGDGDDERPFAVLTFDDGYRDNVAHALPVLRRHGAPWTLYVATEFASGRGRLWWLELEEAIRRLDRVRLALDGEVLDLPAEGAAAKQAAFEAIYWHLRARPEEMLLDAIAELAARAGVDVDAFARQLCLGWDELAALRDEPGLTIGAHTLAHPMLAKHSRARAAREIAESGRILAGRLGRPVRHFAYPVGDPTSAGGREFALAREAGYATAVTTRPGHVFAGHAAHLHALPRVSMNGLHQSAEAIDALLSGVPFLLWNRGRRLDVT